MYEPQLNVQLDAPVLVLGMEGWIDAGLGGGAAVAALLQQVPTEVLGTFDNDKLLDHRARRPVMHLVHGVNTGLTWPEIQLRAGKDPDGKDVLFLVGPEPDLYWRAFSSTVVGVAVDLGVRLVVGLGAFPAPVPHTRPVRLAATATTDELAAEVGFVAGSLDVPAGIHAVLERAFGDVGLGAVGLWARVPHYAAAMPYPAASAALVDALGSLAELRLDSSDLRAASEAASERIDELIAASDEHIAMVRQFEMQVDAVEGEGNDMGMGRLPSGDEIAAQLERFLRGEH